MKILILEGDIYNGITGFRKDLVDELKKEYDVYLAGSVAYEWQSKEDLKNNARIITLGRLENSLFGLFNYQLKLLFLLFKVKPDVCLSFNMRPNLFLGFIFLFRRVKSAATITGTGFLFESNNIKVKLFQ